MFGKHKHVMTNITRSNTLILTTGPISPIIPISPGGPDFPCREKKKKEKNHYL